ncbi:unnamed protein product, partial [Owenia fusiformis]
MEMGTVKMELGTIKTESGPIEKENCKTQMVPNKKNTEQCVNSKSEPKIGTPQGSLTPFDVTTNRRPKRHSAMVSDAKRRAIFNLDNQDDGEPVVKTTKRSPVSNPVPVKKMKNQQCKRRQTRKKKTKVVRKKQGSKGQYVIAEVKINSAITNPIAPAAKEKIDTLVPPHSTPIANSDQIAKPCPNNEIAIPENTDIQDENKGDDNDVEAEKTAQKAGKENKKQVDDDDDFLPDPDDADSDTDEYIEDDDLPSDIGADDEVIDADSDDDYVPASCKSKKAATKRGAINKFSAMSATSSNRGQPYSSLPSCTVTKATAEIIDEIDISDSAEIGENCSILATPSSSKKSKSAFDVLRGKSLPEPKTPKAKHNARFYFNQENRASVKADVGGPAKVVNQALTERWNKLTIEERSEYEAMANADAKRFNIEREEYLAELKRNEETLAAEEKERLAEKEEREANMEAVKLQEGSFQDMLKYVKKSRKAFKELNILDEQTAAEQRKNELLKLRVPQDAANLKQSISNQIASQMKYFQGIKYRGGSIRIEIPNVSKEIYDHIFKDSSHISDPDTFFGKTFSKTLRYGAELTITSGLSVRYTKTSSLLVVSGGYGMDNCGGGWG